MDVLRVIKKWIDLKLGKWLIFYKNKSAGKGTIDEEMLWYVLQYPGRRIFCGWSVWMLR